MSESVVIIAIRTDEDLSHLERGSMAKRLSMVFPGSPTVEAIQKDYADITANDHHKLRELGFDFDAANRIMTVAWMTGE